MIRARFHIRKDDCDNDYRPVKWPIKYPYWCSAESSNSFVLVAYAEDEDSIKELWPEAYDINVLEKDTEIRFTLRFPKPKWYELQEERLEEYDKLYVGYGHVSKRWENKKGKSQNRRLWWSFISRHSWSLHPLSDRGLCF